MTDTVPARGLRRDAGVTLVELLVVLAIFGGVLVLALSVLLTVQRQTSDTTGRADAVAHARLGLAHIDRQVRSANTLQDPLGETPAGYGMRVYTQADGTRTTVVRRCVQWQLSGGVLRTRSWDPNSDPIVVTSPWRAVARDLVNAGTGEAPFALRGSGPYGPRYLDVRLLVKPAGTGGRPVEVTSSLSGRNTAFGYDSRICAVAPAD